MFIAIVGTRYAGKSTIEDYLVSKGFTPVSLDWEERHSQAETNCDMDRTPNGVTPGAYTSEPLSSSPKTFAQRLPNNSTSFLSMSSPITPFESLSQRFPSISFTSPASLLDHVTRNWRSNYVTVALNTQCLIEYFAKRPFFMVIYVDAPLLQRYRRAVTSNTVTLEDFVREHDQLVFRQVRQEAAEEVMNFDILRDIDSLVKISVVNAFSSISALHTHLDSLDLMNKDRLRPAWDTYFMTLADLASRRSNCMKRRVGAILVRDNRIVATGYNGTPRGLTNCNEGGCASCNKKTPSDGLSLECLCLHAEENALLEAGRERVGYNAILYCNTCPCLRCTIKIIQSDVKTVVYNLSYKVDEASAKLFREAGVELRRHIPSTKS